MIKTPSVREVFVWVAFIVSAYFAFVKKWDNVQLQEDKIRSEERIKSLHTNDSVKQIIVDSLKLKTNSLEAVIKYQEKNPKLIIEKHDQIRSNISVLNADSSIGYFASRISKESGNR